MANSHLVQALALRFVVSKNVGDNEGDGADQKYKHVEPPKAGASSLNLNLCCAAQKTTASGNLSSCVMIFSTDALVRTRFDGEFTHVGQWGKMAALAMCGAALQGRAGLVKEDG